METTSHFLPTLRVDDTRKAGSKVNVLRSVELMENYVAGRAYAAEHGIAVASDQHGAPMIFSIGNTDEFEVIVRASQNATGWQHLPLTGSLGKDRVAQQFAAFQMQSGTLVLAVAVESGEHEGASELYVTAPLPADPFTVDWKNLKWHLRPAPRADLTIREISVGRDTDTGAPLLFVSAKPPEGDPAYWLVSASTLVESKWRPYTLPTNATEIIDLAFGNHVQGNGVYALYQADRERVLVFQTIDTGITVELRPPANATKLEVLPNEKGLSTLYVAGDELHAFTPDNQLTGARGTPIPCGPAPSAIQNIVACQDAENIALWLLTKDHRLQYLTCKKALPTRWSDPVLLRAAVSQVAPLRHPKRMSNEVGWVGADGASLGYLTQDPKTNTWREVGVALSDLDKTIHFTSFVSNVTLCDQNNIPLYDEEVTLTASEYVYASINGVYYDVGPSTPVQVKTDHKGCVSITHRVNSLVTPVYTLKASFLRDTVRVNPAAKMNAKLDTVRAEDLPKATTPGPDDEVKRANTAKIVKELVTLTKEQDKDKDTGRRLLRGANAAPGDRSATGDRSASNRISVSQFAEGHCFGADLRETSHAFWGAEEVRVMLAPAPVASENIATENSAGENSLLRAPYALASHDDSWFERAIEVGSDILESLWNGLEKVGRFIVKAVGSAAEFIMDLGARVVKFVVETVEQVAGAISWVLKEYLGIDLPAMVRWLGFVFSWEDILITHKAMFHVTRVGVASMLKKADELEDVIKQTFSDLRHKIVGEKLTFDESDAIFQRRPKEAQIHEQAMLANTPQGSWSQHALTSNLGSAEAEDVVLGLELSAIFAETLKTEWHIIENSVNQVLKDVAYKIDELSIGEIVRNLAVILVEDVVNSLENAALSFVQIAEALGRAVWAILNTRWNVPLLTSLYENKIAPGSKLTLLDLTCLVTAIPATAFYKAFNGEAPFTASQVALFETAETIEELVAVWLQPAKPLALPPANSPANSLLLTSSNTALRARAMLGDPPSAPTITSFSPTLGLRNTLVTITGTHLSTVNRVTFTSNLEGTIVTEGRTNTTLRVRVPQGFSKGPITITSQSGASATTQSDFDIDHDKERANQAQLAMGFLMSFTRLVSGVAYTASEAYDRKRDPKKQYALEVKLVADLFTYVFSVVNASIAIATATEMSARQKIDVAVQYSQIVPRIKDSVQVFIWRKKKAEADRDFRIVLAMLYESLYGVATLPLIIASTVMQAQESTPILTSQEARESVALKGVQNLSNAINQVLSGPKTVPQWASPDLPEVVAKYVMVGTRVVLSLAVLPSFTLTRSVRSAALGLQFTDM
jgi:hypothetical protein